MNQLGFKLHSLYAINNVVNNIEINDIINTIDLLTIKDNGILSNIIKYFIKTNDIRIHIIIDNIHLYQLMKRDYLSLAIYMYNMDRKKSIFIFSQYKNKELIESKDVDMLINNNCILLLELLDGYYIRSNLLSFVYIDNLTNDINPIILNNMYQYISDNISKKELILFKNFLNNKEYKYIIDACNILFYKGKINNKNINTLFKIAQMSNVIVILHQRHIKKYPNIKKYFDDNNILYYLTPYNYDDDLFTILAFINSKNAFIISNDKYRNHIFESKYLQFKFILMNRTLSFDYNHIQSETSSSMCIQVRNNNIYIPCIDNHFIILSMQN